MEHREYLECLGTGTDVAPAGAAFLAWLASIGVDSNSVEFFSAGWSIDPEGMIGTGSLMLTEQIIETASKEPRWLSHGFLLIGSCGNGDPVALDVRDQRGGVFFLSHEVLWSDEEADPRDWSVQVADDLGGFAKSAWDLDSFPIDFWDARPDDGA